MTTDDAPDEYWLVRVRNPQRLMMRRRRIWRTIIEIEGVTELLDISCVSLETLKELVLPEEQRYAAPRKTRARSAAARQ